jgi:signal transduction histidine kinase
MQMVDLAAIVEKVVSFASSQAQIRHCRVTTRIEDRPQLMADDSMISRMLVNLVLNGAEAAGKTGHIEIRLAQDESAIRIEVHDSGTGIAPELRKQVFDPFYSTKEHGSGLGLLSVKVCAAEHDGSVSILDSDLGGACFRVNFPLPPSR